MLMQGMGYGKRLEDQRERNASVLRHDVALWCKEDIAVQGPACSCQLRGHPAACAGPGGGLLHLSLGRRALRHHVHLARRQSCGMRWQGQR